MSLDSLSTHAPEKDAMEPGELLIDLEQRQDEVLAALDELDAKVKAVLKEYGATLEEDGEAEDDDTVPQERRAA